MGRIAVLVGLLVLSVCWAGSAVDARSVGRVLDLEECDGIRGMQALLGSSCTRMAKCSVFKLGHEEEEESDRCTYCANTGNNVVKCQSAGPTDTCTQVDSECGDNVICEPIEIHDTECNYATTGCDWQDCMPTAAPCSQKDCT